MTTNRRVLVDRSVVLLSGGMDSVAALHWAMGRAGEVRALGFDYGQPNRIAELATARKIALANYVRYDVLALADSLNVATGLLSGVSDHDPQNTGANRAFVPGRNLVFLSLAAAHACSWWPTGNVEIVIGATADDAAGFPDCRPNFIREAGVLLRHACARQIDVVAPYVGLSKGGILAMHHDDPAAMADICRSWSCYRCDGPCGKCSACVLRAKAFAAASIADESSLPTMTGGDAAGGEA